MCYGSCPFQKSFSGECSNPIKNSKNPSAHCFEGFTCEFCETVFSDNDEMMEMEKSERTICKDCQEKYSLTECVECGYIAENEEMDEYNTCPDCEKIMFER